MGLVINNEDGQTPLDDDEKDGLLLPFIATRGELDEFEQQNIEQAIQWSMRRSVKVGMLFTEDFMCALHKRMYGNVWAWAGTFRKTNKNIGVDKWSIPVSLRALMDDAAFWLAEEVYPPDEMAIRFKHRLVSVHCFSNGNGRHSRLAADIIIDKAYKLPVFTWGGAGEVKYGDVRAAYLSAVRAADAGDMEPLIRFARS